jgi:hypothetical protein
MAEQKPLIDQFRDEMITSAQIPPRNHRLHVVGLLAVALLVIASTSRSNTHTKCIQNNPVANAIAHGAGTLTNAKGVFCAK